MSLGTDLDQIMQDMDAAYAAIKAAGYPSEGAEQDALEAVYVRLRAWNGRVEHTEWRRSDHGTDSGTTQQNSRSQP